MTDLRVVLLGPPGAGKGTQAKLLQEVSGACQVSTGDILRKAVREKTSLGEEAARYIEKGELVPDRVVLDLVGERLKEKDCAEGFILDGFPRTIAQSEGLEKMLKDMRLNLRAVLSIEVPQGVVVQRLAGRRTCRSCEALFHVTFNPPEREGICDRCGGELFQREDDREETIEARLRVYEEQTAPLIDYYRGQGILRKVEGVGSVEDIRRRVFTALGEAGK